MSTVTDIQFIEALRAAVRVKGTEYVYPAPEGDSDDEDYGYDDYRNGMDCVYSTPEGAPACIIGHALYKIDPDLVPGYDKVADFTSLVDSDPRLQGLSSEVVRAGQRAQALQDEGETWGRALERFEEIVREDTNVPA